MKRTVKRTLVACAAIAVMAVSTFVPAHALEEEPYLDDEIIEDYQYTSSISSALSISDKKASCKSVLIGNAGATKIVLTQKLQKKSGDSWTTVTSWEKTYSTNTASYSNTKSSLSSGTYRTHTVAKVYKGSSYETVKSDSATKSVS